MDNDALTYGLRARAAQLLAWLTSVQQQERQQHIVQADRLTNDGADRGIDDPDNRRQQQATPLRVPTETRQPTTGEAQRTAERLAAQVDALQHQLQAQQQVTRQQGRGQGRGW